MELKEFNKSFSGLRKMFKRGFYEKTNKFGIDVFTKIVNYQLQVLIITSRVDEDIAATKYVLDCLREGKEVSDSELKKFIINLSKLKLDLSDFYIYTRMFLDALTVGIKLSFTNAGNKNGCYMEHTVSCLLNEKKMKTYKEKIDLDFFSNLERHLSWIKSLRESRDGLVHNNYRFVFTKTMQDELGYDIMDKTKTSWGTDTVKEISNEIQTVINSLTELMDYLHTNLPKKTKT